MKVPLKLFPGLVLSVISAVAFSASVHGQVDVVYVTSYTGSTVTGCPPVCDKVGISNFGSSSELTAAPGVPSRTRTIYGNVPTVSWSITPTLAKVGVYKIETAHNTGTASTTSCSTDVLVTLTTTDGVLSPSCQNTDKFQRKYGGAVWQVIGYITNTITEPKIVFTQSGGTVDNSPNRLYIDAFKFTEINPCSGVVADVAIAGPLAADQTTVTVTGVDAAATNISVYADGSLIGEKTSSIVAGANVVTTAALVKGSEIKATQSKSGCSSIPPGSGPIVGGGANPTVNVFLSCYVMSGITNGTPGTNTTGGSITYTLKASGLTSGSQSAPTGGEAVTPGQCWQTITFTPTIDANVRPDSGATVSITDPFSALEGLVFSLHTADPDSGPYDIYVDQIMNGTNIIENFEGYALNSTNTFNRPGAATYPSAASAYLSAPNSSVISTNNAFDGTNSCRIRWQWSNADPVRWAHVVANAATGKRYPLIDNNQPITIQYLVLPVGQSTNKLSFPNLANQNKVIGDSVTFNGAAKGEGPFSYQWQYAGTDIPGATGSTYSKSNLAVSDAGLYSVVAIGASCTATGNVSLAVSDIIPPPPLTSSYNSGTKTLTLSWSASGFVLQQATALTGHTSDWADVPSATSPYQVSAASGVRFYQLKRP